MSGTWKALEIQKHAYCIIILNVLRRLKCALNGAAIQTNSLQIVTNFQLQPENSVAFSLTVRSLYYSSGTTERLFLNQPSSSPSSCPLSLQPAPLGSSPVVFTIVITTLYVSVAKQGSRSLWPRGLKCGSVTARLLAFRIRISPGAWISVLRVLCCKADHSSRGVLPSVVFLSVIVKPR